jgi:hypothetical protein
MRTNVLLPRLLFEVESARKGTWVFSLFRYVCHIVRVVADPLDADQDGRGQVQSWPPTNRSSRCSHRSSGCSHRPPEYSHRSSGCSRRSLGCHRRPSGCTDTHQGVVADHQGVAVAHQGATADRQGVAVAHQGTTADCLVALAPHAT